MNSKYLYKYDKSVLLQDCSGQACVLAGMQIGLVPFTPSSFEGKEVKEANTSQNPGQGGLSTPNHQAAHEIYTLQQDKFFETGRAKA